MGGRLTPFFIAVVAALLGSGLPTSAASSEWEIGPVIAGVSFSPGMPVVSLDGSFEFPVYDGPPLENYRQYPSVHYVTRRLDFGLPPKGTLRMIFEITGEGTLEPTELPDQSPPKVRLFFQRSGDDWRGSEVTQYFRWWSAPFTLKRGVHTMEASLEPAQWSSVLGKKPGDEVAFADALAKAARAGFTFGGAFAGHGVYAKGGAVRFILHSFEVMPTL